MTTHGAVAAKVRAYKAKHPTLYCAHPGCLMRVRVRDDCGVVKPCKKHPETWDQQMTRLVTALRAEQIDEPGNDYEGDSPQ